MFKVFVRVWPMNNKERSNSYSKKNSSIVKTEQDKVRKSNQLDNDFGPRYALWLRSKQFNR